MVSPKIILNEDYLDLRRCPENSLNSRRSNTGTFTTHQRDSSSINNPNFKSDGLRLEKELINCGLKKLVTSYNATASHINQQKQVVNKKKNQQKDKSKYDPRFRRFLVPEDKICLKSLSEISIAPKKVGESTTTSTPLFPREKTSNIEVESAKKKYEIHKNKFTMTKTGSSQERGLRLRHFDLSLGHQGPVPATYAKEISTGFSPLHKEYIVNYQNVDPRLREKYSVLKMPWKRTWTIPVFSHKSSTVNGFKNLDHTDRQTYLYDDGTEIDSIYVEEKQKQIFSNVFQSQFMGILFLGGSICGILLVSLLVWFIFGFDFFHVLFKPKDVQDVPFRRYIKYIGGSMVYFLTNVFRTLGRVLATPTHRVYQAPANHYQWPPIQRHFPED